MTPDDMINAAFRNGSFVPGEGLFVLEGNPTTNKFRVVPADKAFTDNLICFTWNVNTEFQYMGIFTTEKAAEDTIQVIRERFRDESGKRLM